MSTPVDAGRALRRSDVFTQVTVIVGAIEELAPGSPKTASYLPWRVARVSLPRFMRGPRVEKVFSAPVESMVAAAKLTSAVALLVVNPKSIAGRVARAIQASCLVYQQIRTTGLGRDGSDHALVVQEGGQLWAAFSPSGSASERTAAEFLGVQGLLSYLVSGSVKIVSPVWRSGEAVTGVLRTSSYGDAELYRRIKDYPSLTRILAWGVIVGENAAIVVPLLPRPIRVVWQGGMLLMHALIGRFMGLNRFFWGFAAFHPTISFVSESIPSTISVHLLRKRRDGKAGR